MSRRAFVVLVDWPFNQINTLGKCTDLFTGFTENHVSIFVPCCSPKEIATHSAPAVSDATARGKQHVSFDYLSDGYPRFQSCTNPRYWTDEASVWLYPILGASAEEVHAACAEVAIYRPHNSVIYRLNPALGGFFPFHCGLANSDRVAQSHCATLSMRIVARARSGDQLAYTDDRAALRALGVPVGSLANPCSPSVLTGYKPRGALEAMQSARVLGDAVQGFKRAIECCRKGVSLGGTLPGLAMLRPM